MDVSSEKPPAPYDVRSLPAIYLRNFHVASTPILFESDGLVIVRAVQRRNGAHRHLSAEAEPLPSTRACSRCTAYAGKASVTAGRASCVIAAVRRARSVCACV